MNIAIASETVDVRRGGAETSVVEMARLLARRGLNVVVLHREGSPDPTCGGDQHARPATGQFQAAALAAPGATKTARALAYLRSVERWRREHPEFLLHAVTPCLSADVYQPRGGTYAETILRSNAMVRSPLARWVKSLGRRLNRRQQLLLKVEEALLSGPRPPLVACVSDYVRRQVLCGFRGFPPDRAIVVFNGVDVAPRDPATAIRKRAELRQAFQLGEGPLLLFIAHNFKLKGLAELIEALRRRPPLDRRWRLVIAGRDDARPYERRVAAAGLAGHVRFVQTRVPVVDWYAAADLLVHPTWYDPCSRVVLEALCCGLPVVTTELNGAAEMILPGVHGRVIDRPANFAALAAAIESCLTPALRSSCQAAAPAARERLAMSRHVEELTVLYSAAASREPRSARSVLVESDS